MINQILNGHKLCFDIYFIIRFCLWLYSYFRLLSNNLKTGNWTLTPFGNTVNNFGTLRFLKLSQTKPVQLQHRQAVEEITEQFRVKSDVMKTEMRERLTTCYTFSCNIYSFNKPA